MTAMGFWEDAAWSSGEEQEHIIGVPKAEMVIQETDTLVVFGTLNGVKRFLEINS